MVLTSRKPNPQIEMPLVGGKNNDPLLAHWQTGLGKAVGLDERRAQQVGGQLGGLGRVSQVLVAGRASVSRPPMSADFDVQTTQVGDKGKITVEALIKRQRVPQLPLDQRPGARPGHASRTNVKLVQTGPGTYAGEFDANGSGNYVAVLNSRGPNGEGGVMLTGMAVNSSPELRDLKSNEALLQGDRRSHRRPRARRRSIRPARICSPAKV